jgi:hypothetical protein
MSVTGNVLPTYLRSGDPGRRFTDYYPRWLDTLADDFAGPPATTAGSRLHRAGAW